MLIPSTSKAKFLSALYKPHVHLGQRRIRNIHSIGVAYSLRWTRLHGAAGSAAIFVCIAFQGMFYFTSSVLLAVALDWAGIAYVYLRAAAALVAVVPSSADKVCKRERTILDSTVVKFCTQARTATQRLM